MDTNRKWQWQIEWSRDRWHHVTRWGAGGVVRTWRSLQFLTDFSSFTCDQGLMSWIEHKSQENKCKYDKQLLTSITHTMRIHSLVRISDYQSWQQNLTSVYKSAPYPYTAMTTENTARVVSLEISSGKFPEIYSNLSWNFLKFLPPLQTFQIIVCLRISLLSVGFYSTSGLQ